MAGDIGRGSCGFVRRTIAVCLMLLTPVLATAVAWAESNPYRDVSLLRLQMGYFDYRGKRVCVEGLFAGGAEAPALWEVQGREPYVQLVFPQFHYPHEFEQHQVKVCGVFDASARSHESRYHLIRVDTVDMVVEAML